MNEFGFLLDSHGQAQTLPKGCTVNLDDCAVLVVTRVFRSSTKEECREDAVARHAAQVADVTAEIEALREELGAALEEAEGTGSISETVGALAKRIGSAKTRKVALEVCTRVPYEYVSSTTKLVTHFPPFVLVTTKLFPRAVMFVPHLLPKEVAEFEERSEEKVEQVTYLRPRMLLLRNTRPQRAPGFEDVAMASAGLQPPPHLLYCRNDTILAAREREVLIWRPTEIGTWASTGWVSLGILPTKIEELAWCKGFSAEEDCDPEECIYAATDREIWVCSNNQWSSLGYWQEAQFAVIKDTLLVVAERNMNLFLLQIQDKDVVQEKRLEERHGGRLVATTTAAFRVNSDADHDEVTVKTYCGKVKTKQNTHVPLFLLGSHMVVDDKAFFFGYCFPDVTRPFQPKTDFKRCDVFDPATGEWTQLAVL